MNMVLAWILIPIARYIFQQRPLLCVDIFPLVIYSGVWFGVHYFSCMRILNGGVVCMAYRVVAIKDRRIAYRRECIDVK